MVKLIAKQEQSIIKKKAKLEQNTFMFSKQNEKAKMTHVESFPLKKIVRNDIVLHSLCFLPAKSCTEQ